MKAIVRIGILKAIAFSVVIISCLVSCTACEPEDLNPSISISSPESVTGNSAVLVASLSPKSRTLSVNFEYFSNGIWQSVEAGSYSGNQIVIVKKTISNLNPGKSYQFRAEASEGSNFKVTSETKEFKTLDQSILNLKVVKIGLTTMSLTINLVPKFDNTKVQVDYTANGTTFTKVSNSSYSGQTAVDINFNLDNLVKNTDYQLKIKALNSSEAVLDTIIKTCAVTDYDGNPYHIVTIGNQVWLQENFTGTHFANGDPIPNITDQAQWEATTTPAYCWYNNDSKNGEVYGGLYNFYVASDSRGLIIGYHTPSLDEWTTLSDYLGGANVAGGKLKVSGSSGFNGIYSGVRQDISFNKTGFSDFGDGSAFWSTTNFMGMSNVAYCPSIDKTSALLQLHGASYYDDAYSIRLIKN